ncbi:MAG: HAD family phosphatase [Anaerolineae bacterium]|nr:HAD family phosphatase [Anaerolineae bacterium]
MEKIIKAVIFDVGGVLTYDIWEHLLLDDEIGIASQYKLNRDNVEKVGKLLWEAFAYTQETRQNSWEILERKYWDLFIEFFWDKHPPLNVSADKFIQMTNHFIKPVDGMISILERLQSKAVKLAICSNNNEFWFKRQMDTLQLYRFFNPSKIILSCRVGTPKSSPRFEMFYAAIDALGVAPSSCIFVDDREENTERAKQCGMEGIHFKNVQQLDGLLKTKNL